LRDESGDAVTGFAEISDDLELNVAVVFAFETHITVDHLGRESNNRLGVQLDAYRARERSRVGGKPESELFTGGMDIDLGEHVGTAGSAESRKCQEIDRVSDEDAPGVQAKRDVRKRLREEHP